LSLQAGFPLWKIDLLNKSCLNNMYAWVVNLDNGNDNNNDKTNGYYVVCVRETQ